MKKILIIEDDPTMRWLFQYLLRDRYEIDTTHNGLEAFSLLSVNKIPDLILCDITMPVMDGLEFLEKLARSGQYKNIPIIMLSGFEEAETLKRALDLGAYSLLAKPFHPTELLDKLESVFMNQMIPNRQREAEGN